MPLTALALALLGLTASAPRDGDERPPIERDGVLELTLPPLTGVEVEWFRLDPPASARPAEAEGPASPLGLVRLLRVPEADGTLRLESETLLLDVQTRVAHVERLELSTLDVVWREVGVRHGRTVHVAWNRGEEVLRLSDTSGGEIRRREIDASQGVLMPLYLLEQLRAERLSAGEFRRLEPNSCAVELLDHRTGPTPWLRGVRLHTWRRPDGTLAGRYVFCGPRLVAFQLQEGGPVARAVPREAYERLRASGWRALDR
ncbi:MAG: hypothetical protein AAF682_13850 [Planctomycetota bacterium]